MSPIILSKNLPFFKTPFLLATLRHQRVTATFKLMVLFFCLFRYRFVNHYEYLSAWIEKMNLPKKIFLVIHDWGSALGFHWANQHRDRVAGIAFMEAAVETIPDTDWYPSDIKNTYMVFFFDIFTANNQDRVHL